MDDILLNDVLEKNKEPNLYSKLLELAETAEENPPVIFGWEKIELFVAAINTAKESITSSPPCPTGLVLPENLNVLDFKLAILRYTKIPNSEETLGTTALPCTLAQMGYSLGRLSVLNVDPWTAYIIEHGGVNIIPVATVYIPKEGTNTLEYAMEAFPNSLWR